MTKKIQPLFKCYGANFLSSWVLESFPENYQDYDYVEPYCGAAHVLMNKNLPSSGRVEVISDPDLGIVNIFRALRDDPAAFIGRLKRVKYCENTFERYLKKSEGDDLDLAIGEFVLRQMSRGGLKKNYLLQEGENWGVIVEQLETVAERVRNAYIFNKTALSVIQAFDDANTLAYVCPLEVDKDAEDHAKLADYLHQFRGKVIISAYSNAFYKRHYREEDGWRFIKKKTGQDTQNLILNY